MVADVPVDAHALQKCCCSLGSLGDSRQFWLKVDVDILKWGLAMKCSAPISWIKRVRRRSEQCMMGFKINYQADGFLFPTVAWVQFGNLANLSAWLLFGSLGSLKTPSACFQLRSLGSLENPRAWAQFGSLDMCIRFSRASCAGQPSSAQLSVLEVREGVQNK